MVSSRRRADRLEGALPFDAPRPRARVSWVTFMVPWARSVVEMAWKKIRRMRAKGERHGSLLHRIHLFQFPSIALFPASPHPRLPFPPVETLVPCSLCGPIEGRVRPLVAGSPHHHVFIVSISPPEAVTPIFCSFSASRESATWPLVPLSTHSSASLL